MTVMGLSGTGKTTTTFSKQGEVTEPIQDDMVALWPEGELSLTEKGCFAKIDGLSDASEPVIYRATIGKDAWLENAFLNADGSFDFSKSILSVDDVKGYRDDLIATGALQENVDQYIAGSVSAESVINADGVPKDGWDFTVWTQNGRSIVPMYTIPGAADLKNIPQVQSMGILNRDEGRDAAVPGILRFTSPEQAAGYFMLGETSKTSAAGKERGKTRSPFTQPFFPAEHGLQAKRFKEISSTMPGTSMWLMNTGYVGGDSSDVKEGNALKIKIPHSSAMLEAMLTDTIKWKLDEDFGYEIVDVDAPENVELLKKVPAEILQPKRLFVEQKRAGEYDEWVTNIRQEGLAFLEKYKVEQDIISATCPQ